MLDDRLQLTLGLRRQAIESRNYNAAGLSAPQQRHCHDAVAGRRGQALG